MSVRDSKDLQEDPNSTFPCLEVPADRWPMFLAEVLDSNTQGSNGSIFFDEKDNGDVVLTSSDSDVALTYDSDEWAAFKGGVADGDFGPVHASTH